MKLKHLSLILLAAGAVFTSCEEEVKNNDNNGNTATEARAYILNQGLMGNNDANISFYSPSGEGEFTADIFQAKNGKKLGETGQAIVAADGKLYVTVTGSGYVAQLNSSCELENIATYEQPEGGAFQPRSIAVTDGRAYVSYYGGKLASYNASDLSDRKVILDRAGSNFEGVATIGSKVYVCQSYTQKDGGYVYFDKVFGVDTKSGAVEEITVGVNPNDITAVGKKLYLLSWGNYADCGYSFQVIDTEKGNKVTPIAPATKMAAGKEFVYLVNSETDWSTYTTTNTFFKYDIARGAVVEESFLKNAPAELASANIYMMAVDPKTGDLYVSTTTYVSEGTIYRFDAQGNFVAKFLSGGINPCGMAFIY